MDMGDGRKASNQASTSQAPRPPVGHPTKHIFDPIPLFGLKVPVVAQKRAEHAHEMFMIIS